MAVTRIMIEELIRKINEAENSRPNCTVEETIAACDVICAPDFEGRLNSEPFHDRETERQGERMLFTSLRLPKRASASSKKRIVLLLSASSKIRLKFFSVSPIYLLSTWLKSMR